jgi:UDP-N-acetylmuramate: L-alanyl-gamma-D-glutamyl-meso-diaminopimelate ligase
VVITGTHGKTTTTALVALVLRDAGRDPGWFIGGVPLDLDVTSTVGGGPEVVLEGDEYDTAYFDKGPKFLHYRPRTAILTSIEFDHADIFRDLAHYEAAFERFVRLLPPDGCLAVSAAYPNALRIARTSPAHVVTYGMADVAEYSALDLGHGPDGVRFTVLERGRPLGAATLPGGGAHNVENAMGVVAAARALGLEFREIAAGLATFAGVRRRQEVSGEAGGVVVIDDFAHHPTAVRSTIDAIRARFPGRRLWAAFEPRSNTSRRRVHQAEYVEALSVADLVALKVPEPHDMVPADERLDAERVVADLRARGVDARADADVDRLVRVVAEDARPGDVVLVMSNGAFGSFIDRLLAALRPNVTTR